MDPKTTVNEIMIAMRNYENMRRASRAYYERKKQKKIDDGTYRGRGRPRKDDTPPIKNEFVAVNPV